MPIEIFESSLQEINEALKSVFYAKERGYKFFDFHSGIEKMFHYYSGKEEKNKKRMQDLYNVFNDLFKPKYLSFCEVEKTDNDRKEYVLKVYKQSPFTNSYETSEITVPINDFNFGIGDRLNQHHLSKYNFYLEGVTSKDEKGAKIDVVQWTFNERYQKLFEKHGVSIFPEDPTITFEKYIRWIDVNDEVVRHEVVNKLKWKGTPAQFAYIITLLQEKGYISGLTASGERNGELLLKLFEFENHNPTKQSLGKYFQQIKKDEFPINAEDSAKFLKFPHRNELKR